MSASQTHIKSASNTDISDGPPPLNYSLNDRKRSIAITWSIILADSCLLPIIMFYSLWFTKLSHETGKKPICVQLTSNRVLISLGSLQHSVFDIWTAQFRAVRQTNLLLNEERLYLPSNWRQSVLGTLKYTSLYFCSLNHK